MIALTDTTHTLEVTTSSAADLDYACSWVDTTTTAFTPGSGHGTIASATTTTIVAAPAASTQRGVKHVSLRNRHASTSQTVTVKKDVSATEYEIAKATLAAGQSLVYEDGEGWRVHDANGIPQNAIAWTTTIQGISAVSAGTQNATSGGLTLANSNGVSFGLNAGVVTASVLVTAAADGVNLIAAGSQTAGTTGTVLFANSNGVTFGMSNSSVVTAAYSQSTHSHATQSVQTENLVSIQGSTGAISFANSNGLAFGFNASTITGSYTVPGATVFSNSNNVTFGLSGSTVTASVSMAAGAGDGYNILAAGTQTAGTAASVVLSNSNGLSFGMSNSSVITGAYSQSTHSHATQSAQPVAAGASNGSFAFSTLSFHEGSGVTWKTDATGIAASVKTDYQTSGAYLTTAAVSNYTVPGATVFSNSNNVSFGLNGSTVTATATVAQSVQPVAASASNGSYNFSTLKFVEGSGVTWATQAGGIQASVATNYQSPGAYLTTAAVSNYTVPGATVFSNSNNVSFGLNGSTVTATATMAQSVQPVAASASNGSYAFSTIKFVEGSGITWATQAGGIQGSVKTDYQTSGAYLTTAAVSNYTVPGATVFSNSNNVSFGLNGSTVTATATVAQSVQPVAASASNGSYNFSTIKFVEGSGITWATQVGGIQGSVKTDYQTSGAYLTTAALSTHTHGSAPSVTGSIGVTSNSSAWSISIPAFITTAAASDHAHSDYLTTARASNDAIGLNTALTGNGVSVTANSSGWSMNVPAFLTTAQAPGAYLTTARASNDAVGLNTALTGNGVAWTVNSSGLSLNVPAFITTAANSTHSHGNPTLSLSNLSGATASASNGLTISLTGSNPVSPTIWMNTGARNVWNPGQGSVHFNPIADAYNVGAFPFSMSVNTLYHIVYGGVETIDRSFTLYGGIYTISASHTANIWNSYSVTWGAASNATISNLFSGYRYLPVTTFSSALVMTPGQYAHGYMISSANSNATMGIHGYAEGAGNMVVKGTMGATSNSGGSFVPIGGWQGLYSATSAGLPVTVAFTQLLRSAAFELVPTMIFNQHHTSVF